MGQSPCFDTSLHVLRPQCSRAALAKIVQAARNLEKKSGITVLHGCGRRSGRFAYRQHLSPTARQKNRAELLVRVSFDLLAAAIVGKARVDDGALADLSRNVLESEIGRAAVAYLEASIRAGAKPIRPTRIRTLGTRKAR